jgi:hypothetical protein
MAAEAPHMPIILFGKEFRGRLERTCRAPDHLDYEMWLPYVLVGTPVAGRGRVISPHSSATPYRIRWTVSEGRRGRESSPSAAGSGLRGSQRHRSSCSSSGPSVSGAAMSFQGLVTRGHRALDELNAHR